MKSLIFESLSEFEWLTKYLTNAHYMQPEIVSNWCIQIDKLQIYTIRWRHIYPFERLKSYNFFSICTFMLKMKIDLKNN